MNWMIIVWICLSLICLLIVYFLYQCFKFFMKAGTDFGHKGGGGHG